MKFLSFIFVVISFSTCTYAEVYKCQTPDGKISYQASPCKDEPILAAPGEDMLPAATLEALKEATVFIKVAGNRVSGSGTGFLVAREANVGYIVTNAHVVESDRGFSPTITVVFKSGRKDEAPVKAVVVTIDPSSDLAILKIEMANLPAPVSSSIRGQLHETMPVYMLGFPFGKALSLTAGNPAITVSKGTISSIRMDKYNQVGLVQIDGSMNPGNSGGPVVDSTGSLIGVATAKVAGTQIGLAIPIAEVEEMLRGRISGIAFKELQNADGKIKLEVTLRLLDPLRKVQRVTLLVIPKDENTAGPKPNEKGAWDPVSPGLKVRSYDLNIEDAEARKEIEISSDAKQDKTYLLQPAFVRKDDSKLYYLQPAEFQAAFGRGRSVDKSGGEDWLTSPSSGTVTSPTPSLPQSQDDWLGSNAKGTMAKSLEVVESNTVLAGNQRNVVDATVFDINLSKVTQDLLWSEDGKSFYALEQDHGRLHQISIPDFKDLRSVEIGRECSSLALSREGLLVLCPNVQELMVFDEHLLQFKKRIAVAGARSVASAPTIATAFLAMSDEDELGIVDLSMGKMVKILSARQIQQEQGGHIRKHKQGVTLSGFEKPAVTADGRYLFAIGFECLHRFSINGNSLIYEEMGPRIGSNPQRIEISADSNYVALPSGGGNSKVNDHPPLGSYGTYVYKVTDLLMPVLGVNSGAYPTVLELDKAAGKLYSSNFEKTLITFNTQGVKEKEYMLAERGEQTRQILSHPSGNKLLVRTEKHIFWVELPK